jgi:hypothetical protein
MIKKQFSHIDVLCNFSKYPFFIILENAVDDSLTGARYWAFLKPLAKSAPR